MYWTDSEIFVIEPSLRLSELIDDNYDAIMSKDWGGHQLNPGRSYLVIVLLIASQLRFVVDEEFCYYDRDTGCVGVSDRHA